MTGASRYVLGQGRGAGNDNIPPGEAGRVAWIGGTGFGFEIAGKSDAELGVRIMEFDALNQASRTKRCDQDVIHLMLAWRPGETPTRNEMEAAALQALGAIGMANAKAIWASHTDEDHPHLHILASKINPDTGRAYDLKGNFFALSKWAETYEREHGGVICLRRQEANALRDGIEVRDAADVLEAMTEQRPTFTAADLERALAKQINDEQARAAFATQILGHAAAVALLDQPGGATTRYTTNTVLAAEQHVLRAADSLAKSDRHTIAAPIREGLLGSDKFRSMSPEQVHAYRHSTGASGLSLIDGQAGTGKSYTMAAIREAYETGGYKVIGLAPTNIVAQDMKRDGFSRAGTVHAELFALNNERVKWHGRTVVMIDEAAMLDTKMMAVLTSHAHAVSAKLILIGDDRQLSSIARGGMYGVLKDRHGAAELTDIRRQYKEDERRAASMMAEGNFHEALGIYDAKGAINWTRTQGEARARLVATWADDSAAEPSKSRFVFAYTNADVAMLNADIRDLRHARGELGADHLIRSKDGMTAFATGDRLQFTATDKKQGLFNGAAGTVKAIEGSSVTVLLDGRAGEVRRFDSAAFAEFRHGYAGTIYKGQGRTLDQTYLYHSEHWRSAASYVALTRHRNKAELFVATNTARDVKQLARQMARVDDRRAASQFHHETTVGAERVLTPYQLMAALEIRSAKRQGTSDDPASAKSDGGMPSHHSEVARLVRAVAAGARLREPMEPDRYNDLPGR